MKTRKDYMDHKVTHREYHAQFVTDRLKRVIAGRWFPQHLTEKYKEDEHLNNIPLAQWDSFKPYVATQYIAGLVKDAGDYLTMAGIVCIAKEAAKQIIDEHLAPND